VSALRKLIGPSAIATVPGRGYRFTARLDDATDQSEVPPAETPRAAAGNLPAYLAPLYGRDAQIAALSELVQAHRLVTVVGAGGIGKSRLAQACADALAPRFVDGVWMIELAGVSAPGLLGSTVTQALGIRSARQDSVKADVIASLAGRRMLLVLDNCEHLLDAVGAFAEALLRGTHVTLLATSQEPLRLPEEQQYRLAPLDEPGGLALLEARVGAVDARFALAGDDLLLARDICRRLDGLPLAIELAAARVPTLGLRGVRDKLDARFKLLTGGARSTLRRHQTLRAALEWSHHLLSGDERIVFRRLGAFAGGFTVELAQAVASDGSLDAWCVLDLVSQLVDKSLVSVDPGDPPRYRLLESARAFALEQLAADDGHDTLRRHAIAMRDFIQAVDGANLDGNLRSDEYASIVLPELDNLRAAYVWASQDGSDPALAAAIAAHCGSLVDYAFECGDWLLACRSWVDRPGVEDEIAARYWRALAASNMVTRVAMIEQAAAAQRAQALYRSLGEPRRVVSSLIRLAMCQSRLQDVASATRTIEESARARAPRLAGRVPHPVAATRRRARTPCAPVRRCPRARTRRAGRECCHRRSPPAGDRPQQHGGPRMGDGTHRGNGARCARVRAGSARASRRRRRHGHVPREPRGHPERARRYGGGAGGRPHRMDHPAAHPLVPHRRLRPSIVATRRCGRRGHSCSGPPTRRCARALCARSTRRG
jgi:predicted ATPase